MIARSLIALAALAALTGAKDDPLRGYTPSGPATRCAGDSSATPVILDRHRIGLRRGSNRMWVSDIASCPSLDPYSTLIVERFGGGPLCRNDRFRVLTPGVTIPSRTCFFSTFTPYDRVKRR